MKKLFIIGIMVCLFVLNFEAKAQQGNIKLIVKGFKSDKGQAMIALYNSKNDFSKKLPPFNGVQLIIKNNSVEYVFENIPYGKYAIAVYHDKNLNKILDKGFMGLPKENYGFSNNAWRKFGRPSFKQATFQFDGETKVVEINIRSGVEKEK